jgi:hypothetical protein
MKIWIFCKMSSNVQDMKNIAMLKDSEAYKYFKDCEPAYKYVKTHKREPSMHVATCIKEHVQMIGKKRPRED